MYALIFVGMNLDEHFMQRCIQLALTPNEGVFPNPNVGSVVVYDQKIIGEGFHKKFGTEHAEVNAIASVKDKELLKDSTLYVNLEPCCHHGKTPPCSQLIIASKIKRVVVGCLDPNPLVSGKGIQMLKEAGIEVSTNVLETECLHLNKRFIGHINDSQKNISITVKWAETADGFMGKMKYYDQDERKLSNDYTNRWVHKLRAQHQGILVGINTVLSDNPSLNTRHWFGNSPTIIIMDPHLKFEPSSKLNAGKNPIIIFNGLKNEVALNIQYIKLNFELSPFELWTALTQHLSALSIYSLLIEGGPKTIQSFFASGISHKIVRIKTPKQWNEGISAPLIDLKPSETFNIFSDKIEIFQA